MQIKKLREALRQRDPNDLRDDIIMLYRKFDLVRYYYDLQLNNNAADTLLKKYKKILEKQFFPKNGEPELKYSIARSAISEFKRVCNDHQATIDLELTFVEYGVKYTLEYGDINARFYHSMASMFQKALKDMEEEGLLDLYESRCRQILKNTEHLGWGFGDEVEYLYATYFPNIE